MLQNTLQNQIIFTKSAVDLSKWKKMDRSLVQRFTDVALGKGKKKKNRVMHYFTDVFLQEG